MARVVRHAVAVSVSCLMLAACTSEHTDSGQYRVVDVDGLFCQPRKEFYFVDRSSEGIDPLYLGTCGSPGLLRAAGDSNCFSIAENGEAIVYIHRPEFCGAGAKATRKAGGVYVHSAAQGDRLIYDSSKASQIWSAGRVPLGAIRVGWLADVPSRGGASCGQMLVIHADGLEEVEGRADPLCGVSQPAE